MKFKIEYKKLKETVEKVAKASDIHADSLYSCIKIEAQLGKIALSATNLEISIKMEAEAEVMQQGSIFIGAKTFARCIQKTKADSILIESNDKDIIIKSVETGSRTTLLLPNITGEFPKMQQMVLGEISVVSGKEFFQIVRKVLFVGDDSAGLTEIQSVAKVAIKNDSLLLQVMDQARVAVRSQEAENQNDGDIDMKIKLSVLREIANLIKDFEEVKLIKSDKSLHIQGDGLFISGRILDGTVVDAMGQFKKMLPHTNAFTIDRYRLIDSLERADILDFHSNRKIFCLDIRSDGSVDVSAIGDNGVVEDRIEITKDAVKVQIHFNLKYALEIFKALNGTKLEIHYSDAKSPILIYSDEYQYMYMLMPVLA